MFGDINERFDIEHQVVRAISYEIARRAWSPGDAVPSPHDLAKGRILNPHAVESAYAKLAEAGLLVPRPEGDYRIAADARRLAREWLLQWAVEEVRDLVGSLRRAGLSGEDIERDFRSRTGCFSRTLRVALNAEQVEEYNLPPQVGKATDSRAASFVARHGRLVQVELDALPPDILRGLYADAIGQFWDMSAYEAVLEREREERKELMP